MSNSIKHNRIKPATEEQDERTHNGYVLRTHAGAYDYRSQHGRSYAFLDCAFCGTQVKVFIWSLAGGGKRCYGCGAMLTGRWCSIPEADMELVKYIQDVKSKKV